LAAHQCEDWFQVPLARFQVSLACVQVPLARFQVPLAALQVPLAFSSAAGVFASAAGVFWQKLQVPLGSWIFILGRWRPVLLGSAVGDLDF